MKNNVSALPAPCTGCAGCTVVCPVQAIRLRLNEEGFFVAEVDDLKCINCGRCVKVCVRTGDLSGCRAVKDGKLSAARSKDPDILKNASSGGVVSELYTTALSQNCSIIGTEYDVNSEKALMRLVHSKNDIFHFAGSKYLQSYPCTAWQEAISHAGKAEENKTVIVGTPCQIFGIHKVLSELKIRDQFILVDFFCHGVPSYLVWNAYLDQIKQQLKSDHIESVVFRDKTNGWHNYWMKISAQNQQYSSLGSLDPFYTAFFDNQFLNKSCLKCKLRACQSMADIRVGDFWGRNFAGNEEGVSAVITLSEKGQTLFRQCTGVQVLEEFDPEVILTEQRHPDYEESPLREQLFIHLAKTGDLSETMHIYQQSDGIPEKTKRMIKKILKQLPDSAVLALRKRKII